MAEEVAESDDMLPRVKLTSGKYSLDAVRFPTITGREGLTAVTSCACAVPPAAGAAPQQSPSSNAAMKCARANTYAVGLREGGEEETLHARYARAGATYTRRLGDTPATEHR